MERPGPLNLSDLEIVDEQTAAILRRKTPAERFAIGLAMSRSIHRMLRYSIEQSHPDWARTQVQAEMARRMNHGRR